MDSSTQKESASPVDKQQRRRLKPVYRRRNPRLPAECIYFYHLLPNETVNVYYVDRKETITQDDIPCQIVKILQEIEAGLPAVRRPVQWRRKSHFVAVLADPSNKLDEGDAVEFQCLENDHKNHSFRDGRDIRQLPAPYESFTAFCCFNHMRHRNGHVLLRREAEEYKILFNHPHAHIARRRFGHDDSATNLGPPLPPP